jgi:hypothetical protein
MAKTACGGMIMPDRFDFAMVSAITVILLLSGRFADEHQTCVFIACAENDVGSRFAKLAFFTFLASAFDFFECFHFLFSP